MLSFSEGRASRRKELYAVSWKQRWGQHLKWFWIIWLQWINLKNIWSHETQREREKKKISQKTGQWNWCGGARIGLWGLNSPFESASFTSMVGNLKWNNGDHFQILKWRLMKVLQNVLQPVCVWVGAFDIKSILWNLQLC